MPDEVLTIAEAAAILRISPRAVYDLMALGQLEYVLVTRRSRRITREQLNLYLEACRRGGCVSELRKAETRHTGRTTTTARHLPPKPTPAASNFWASPPKSQKGSIAR